jgi:hypothetical protein
MEPTAIYATREGNLGGETVQMSVDAASMAHVMSILTDLYSDPTLAVIREYSTNALDSHVEAGVKRPIDVSLPNAMTPFFKVRDYGVGLSVEDIRNVYSKYGASTKRSTNEQVGMLGLGCKSALTYTQQFTIRSVKDGILSHVAISRTENGSGVMQVVCTQPSDEPNGVEISVPVPPQNDFAWKAVKFFKYWEPGTVLIDGVEPARYEGLPLSDSITLVKSSSSDFIVMGNVAYRVSTEHSLFVSSRYTRNFGIVAHVPIGSINFTPSREDLHYTEHTLKTLSAVRDDVKRFLVKTIQDSINAKPTAPEARVEWQEWRTLTSEPLTGLKYHGKTIPTSIEMKHLRYTSQYGRNTVDTYSMINFNDAARHVLISGYEKRTISTAHRVKMRLWAAQNGYPNASFIVTENPIDQTWFTSTKTVAWSEVFATKPERAPREVGNETYSVSQPGSRYAKETKLSDIDKTKTLIVWTSGEDGYEDRIGDIIATHGNALGIRLPKNRWGKFLRENPKAVKVGDILPKIVQEAFDALSDDEKLSMSIDYNDRADLSQLEEKRLDDPELARYTRVVQSIRRTDAIDKYNKIANIATSMGFDRPKLDTVDSPRLKYPLLAAVDNYGGLATEHFYMYANSLYANEVKNA